MTRDHIRRVLDTIYDKVFNQGQADLYPGLVSGPYIQHNPLFANGLDVIVGYIKQVGRIPCEVKRVAIDGDLAFVHVRYLDWGGQETAGVDIFRFDADGKIVERSSPTVVDRGVKIGHGHLLPGFDLDTEFLVLA